jgi:hypothetical protein
MNSKNESPSKESEDYPTIIRLSEKDLPEIAKYKYGGKYTITLEVECTAISKGDEYAEDSKDKAATRVSLKLVRPAASKSDSKRPELLANALKKRV